MADPALWYYPSASAGLRNVDFGEGLTEFVEDDLPERADARSGDLTPWPAYAGTTYRRTIILERFGEAGGTALERRLQTFLTHVRKGGLFGFAVDADKAWAGLATTAAGGDTSLATTGSGFTIWAPDATLAAGDEVVVESSAPEWNYEIHSLDALSGRTVTLNEPLAYDYGRYVLVRHRDFLPVCYVRPEDLGQAILTTDARIGYTLRLPATYLPGATIRLWAPRALETPYQAAGRWGLPSSPTIGALPLRGEGSVVQGDDHTLESLLSAWSGGSPYLGDPRRWR
jgi:hypothetical protein